MDRETYAKLNAAAINEGYILVAREFSPDDTIFWNHNIPEDHDFVLINISSPIKDGNRDVSFETEEELLDYLVTLRMSNA